MGARGAVLGEHAENDIVVTEFNGEYIVIALTTDEFGVPIPFPIKISSTNEGFQPTTVILQASEKINGAITRDLTMMSDGDGDGISDTVENASLCLKAYDVDTDDDGILDGN